MTATTDRVRDRLARASRLAVERAGDLEQPRPRAQEQHVALPTGDEPGPTWCFIAHESTGYGKVEVHYLIKDNGHLDHRVRRIVHPSGAEEIVNLHQNAPERRSGPFTLPRARDAIKRDTPAPTKVESFTIEDDPKKVWMSLRRGRV